MTPFFYCIELYGSGHVMSGMCMLTRERTRARLCSTRISFCPRSLAEAAVRRSHVSDYIAVYRSPSLTLIYIFFSLPRYVSEVVVLIMLYNLIIIISGDDAVISSP